jgi:DNA-directed RNA polymerase specialized sigma subunit
MTIGELREKRVEFKDRVREYLKDPALSYREIGDMVGVSGWRICQIRKELGLPNRVGGRRNGRRVK